MDTPRAVGVIYVIVMVALIVGIDVAIFRHHFFARLLANTGIVLLFGALYMVYVRHH